MARTKFLAKVASGVAKPDGLLVVPPDGELAFLHPLPVERLWGVGPVTARKLHDRGIRTVGEVGRLAEPALAALLGTAIGPALHALAHNRDPRPRPAADGAGARSASQRALGRSPQTAADDRRAWSALVDRVTRRMRRGRPGGAHGGAAVALRRLPPGDPLAHAAAGRPPRPRTMLVAGAHAAGRGACR